MAAMTCPYCGHAIVSDAEAPAAERCPKCSGELLIAYRYQLVRARGEVAGGEVSAVAEASGGFQHHHPGTCTGLRRVAHDQRYEGA